MNKTPVISRTPAPLSALTSPLSSLISLIFLALLLSCSGGRGGDADSQSSLLQKKGSSGKTLEVLVVADPDIYRGETKDLIDSLFGRPQQGLYWSEPMFDVVNIPVSSYHNTDMFHNHRNIILIDVSYNNPDKVYMHIDEYAAPQVIFDFAVTSPASLRTQLRKYGNTMVTELYNAEHRRVIKAFHNINHYQLNDGLKEKFGFTLTFSNEFTLAKEAPNFAWVRKESKDSGIGLLIDVMPYTDKDIFDEKNLLDRIDTVMRRHVPAGEPGSYMGLERRRDDHGHYLAPIYRRTVEFPHTDYCVETRGNWRTFGDFMGGPFLSYALLTPDKQRVVILTAYVYCPRNKPFTRRDLLMQMEGVCYSLQF